MVKTTLVFFAVTVVAILPSNAGTFYAAPTALVDPDNPNYCQLPECAGTLQDAVYMATNDCDFTEVVLADGTYHADWNWKGLEIQFIRRGYEIKNNKIINFDINFTNLTVRSASGDPTRCVIDGGGSADRHRCFYLSCDISCQKPYLAQFTVSGITFRNFHLDAEGTSLQKGAVIYAGGEEMSYNVENCVFEDCVSGKLGAAVDWESNGGRSAGGAIYAYGNEYNVEDLGYYWFRVKDSMFRKCHSAGTGAAICAKKRLLVSDCRFEGCISSNSVPDVSYYAGTVAYDARGNEKGVIIMPVSWASNCVFRDNFCYSAREMRGGAVHNLNTYRCKFYNNGCHGSVGGYGGTIWGYNDADKFAHIEDEVDNSDRPPEWSFHQSELRGGRYYRCRFGGSNRVEATESTLSGNISSFYNCLFQDFYYYNYKPTRAINCTFARCRWGNHSWNGFFMEKGVMINSAMLECESMNGCIVEYTNEGFHGYAAGGVAMTNSVYYASEAKRIHPDWGEKGNNTWYRPGEVPGQAGTQYYSYLNPASSTDPFRPARDCYLVDKGIKLEGMDVKGDLMSRDLIGNPRCVGGAPDIGCYEYYVKPGISVMLR